MTDGSTRFVHLRLRPTGSQVAVVVVLTAAMAVLTSWAAHDGEVGGFEESVLTWINSWPGALEPIMWFVQQVGVLFAPIAVGAVLALAARRWTLIIPFILVLPLKLLIEKAVVKEIVQRERPFVSLGDEIVVLGGAFEGLSFPSGHTTTAFATAALVVGLLPRRWRPVVIVWALLVGVARMYMGEHNLYDVVCGAALGTMFGVVLWYAVLADDRIGGPVVPDRDDKRFRLV